MTDLTDPVLCTLRFKWFIATSTHSNIDGFTLIRPCVDDIAPDDLVRLDLDRLG